MSGTEARLTNDDMGRTIVVMNPRAASDSRGRVAVLPALNGEQHPRADGSYALGREPHPFITTWETGPSGGRVSRERARHLMTFYLLVLKWTQTKATATWGAVVAQIRRTGEEVMSRTETAKWDAGRVIDEGFVGVRDLSQHTTQVLKAAEKRGRTVLVTRHGQIVASINPITMPEVVDRILRKNPDLTVSMAEADAALIKGDVVPIAKLISGEFADADAKWRPEKVIEDGFVAVRDLSQHTTQVLRAVEERGRPTLITRRGEVVATICPMAMRDAVAHIVESTPDLNVSLRAADEALIRGDVTPMRKLR